MANAESQSTVPATAPTNESHARHTPGPWRIGESLPSNLEREIRGDGFHVASVWAGISRDLGGPDEIDANARLIAAAPELLAALKVFVAAQAPCACLRCERAKAAIATVEGK